MDSDNAQTPDTQAITPAATVTDVAPNSQVITVPTPAVTPAPTPAAPTVNPLIDSVQTQKAIEFFKANPDVLEHVIKSVSTNMPDFNPAPDQFVSRKQYTLDRAVALHGLSDDDAALLATADVSTIPALAQRLAAANNTVKPTEPVAPTAAAPLPKPQPASGKKAPVQIASGDDLAAAFQAFKGDYA